MNHSGSPFGRLFIFNSVTNAEVWRVILRLSAAGRSHGSTDVCLRLQCQKEEEEEETRLEFFCVQMQARLGGRDTSTELI